MISEHNEGREPTMVDVREVLAKLSEGKRDNPAVLAINAHRLMQAKNNGFPKHMYHPKLDPVVVLSEEQELRIRALGYQDNYQHRLYPRTLFRRNMDPKFELRLDRATGAPVNLAYIEERIVASREIEDAVRKLPAPKGCGPWVYSLDQIDPLPEAPDEDPAVTIARLEGRLEEVHTGESKGKKRAEA